VDANGAPQDTVTVLGGKYYQSNKVVIHGLNVQFTSNLPIERGFRFSATTASQMYHDSTDDSLIVHCTIRPHPDERKQALNSLNHHVIPTAKMVPPRVFRPDGTIKSGPAGMKVVVVTASDDGMITISPEGTVFDFTTEQLNEMDKDAKVKKKLLRLHLHNACVTLTNGQGKAASGSRVYLCYEKDGWNFAAYHDSALDVDADGKARANCFIQATSRRKGAFIV
jgi:hypothetical protein